MPSLAWARSFRWDIWRTPWLCSSGGATPASSSRSATSSLPWAAPPSSGSWRWPCSLWRVAAEGRRRDGARRRGLACAASRLAPRGHSPDRVRRGGRRVHGEVQARPDSVDALGHAGAAGGARAGRGARRRRAGHRRGAGEVRCGLAALPPARRGHGTGHHRHHHDRGHAGALRRRPPRAHRPLHGGRRRVPLRVPALERPDSLLRHPDGQDGRRVARVDTLRRGGDHGLLVARRAARRAPGAADLMRLSRVRSSRVWLVLLPAGLEEATRAAFVAGDGPRSERCLMVFFAALVRDLALDADRRLAGTKEAPAARVAAGQKFLEAIWRYYNLVDFAVGQYDPKAAVTVRLAFEEAEGYAQGGKTPGGGSAGPEARGVAARAVRAPDPEKMREPVQRIARTLSGLIEASITAWR